MNIWIAVSVFSLCFSFFFTRAIIYLLGKRLMDIPSERSSHTQPTPRGGGIAIAITIILAMLWINSNEPSGGVPIAFIALFALMATLGAIDDFMNLAIRPRLAVQVILAAIGVFLCFRNIDYHLPVLLILGGIAVCALVWQSNLYNFMDGINGIAAAQAICVSFIMGSILLQTGADIGIVKLLAIVGFASAGFLYWNFPRARIFMGDSGSLFLGFVFGLVAIKTGSGSFEVAVAWLIAMAIFIVDASYTLGVRLLTGQKFYLPHRSHSYQKLAYQFNSHAKVTLLVFIVNLLWLFPIILLMTSALLNPFIALCLAYAPLIFVAARLKAGSPN